MAAMTLNEQKTMSRVRSDEIMDILLVIQHYPLPYVITAVFFGAELRTAQDHRLRTLLLLLAL
jgi:hypothetical protein